MKFLRKLLGNTTIEQSLNILIYSCWIGIFTSGGALIFNGKPTWTLLICSAFNASVLTYAYKAKQHRRHINVYTEAYNRLHEILEVTFKRGIAATPGIGEYYRRDLSLISQKKELIPVAISVMVRDSFRPRRWGMEVRIYGDTEPDNNGEWILSYGHANTDIQDNANWRKTGMKIIIGFMLCLFSCGVDYEYIDGIPGGIYKTLSVSLYSEGICPGYYPTMVLKLDEPRGEPRKELAKMKSCDIGYILTASDYGAKLDLSLVRDLPAPGWMDSTVFYIAIVTFDSVVVYRDTVNFEGFKFTIPQR